MFSGIRQFMRRTFLWVLAVPLLLTFLGASSNQLVLRQNGDRFPVKINAAKLTKYANELNKAAQSGDDDAALQLDELMQAGYIDDTHVVMTDKTHLNALADWIDFRGDGIYSPGDLLLDLGSWSWDFAPLVWGLLAVRKMSESD